MLEHASPLIRLLAQRDALHHDASLLERELAIFRAQRQRKPAHQRPHYSPAERSQILEVVKLRGWSAKEAGSRFVVHPNTIRNWEKAVDDKLRSVRLLGGPPWNRLHDGVRRLVHEIREAFPEPEFGTRISCAPASGSAGHRSEECCRKSHRSRRSNILQRE
jgi:transposase-like protein